MPFSYKYFSVKFISLRDILSCGTIYFPLNQEYLLLRH